MLVLSLKVVVQSSHESIDPIVSVEDMIFIMSTDTLSRVLLLVLKRLPAELQTHIK